MLTFFFEIFHSVSQQVSKFEFHRLFILLCRHVYANTKLSTMCGYRKVVSVAENFNIRHALCMSNGNDADEVETCSV